MYILALETTGPFASVSLIDNEGKITSKTSGERLNHLKDLTPMARELLSEVGAKASKISAVASSVGPGSFTGIRIGVATARAISQALDIPCISVPTISTFKLEYNKIPAAHIMENSEEASEIIVCPILDARRGQVYGGIFTNNINRTIEEGNNRESFFTPSQTIMEQGPYMLDEVLEKLNEALNTRALNTNATPKLVFFGDGIDAYKEKIYEKLQSSLDDSVTKLKSMILMFPPKEERYQNAEAVATLALMKYKLGQVLTYNELLPDYMRKTEAEQKLEDGLLTKWVK